VVQLGHEQIPLLGPEDHLAQLPSLAKLAFFILLTMRYLFHLLTRTLVVTSVES